MTTTSMRRITYQRCAIAFGIGLITLFSSHLAKAQWATSGSGDAYNNNSSGKVGIGTTSPGSSLDVSGGYNSEIRFGANNGYQQGVLGLSVRSNYDHILFSRNLAGTAGSDNYQTLGTSSWGYNGIELRLGGDIFFYGSDASTTGGATFSSLTARMAIRGTGNVGIGTTSPSTSLHISASSPTRGIAQVIGASGSTGAQIQLTQGGIDDWAFGQPAGTSAFAVWSGRAVGSNGTERFRIDSSGNVGIGTTSPGVALDIGGIPIAANQSKTIRIASPSGGNYFGGGLEGGFDSSGSGFVKLHTYHAGADYTVLYGNSSGNVGIGTTSPTEKLHVAGNGKITGNLTVDGNINAKYQDVAEWVPAAEQLPVATVVVLDTNKSNQVTLSTQAYDTRVAGVISEQPGIALGEGGAGKVLVATTGRVRVKVDATRGAIHIGDLLVTSDVPGLAMKSEPIPIGGRMMHMPGTLIGKALEPLEKGKGEILVLLSLQ